MDTQTFLVNEKTNKALWEKLKEIWANERFPGTVIFEHNSYTAHPSGRTDVTFTARDEVGVKTQVKSIDASPKPDFNTRPK